MPLRPFVMKAKSVETYGTKKLIASARPAWMPWRDTALTIAWCLKRLRPPQRAEVVLNRPETAFPGRCLLDESGMPQTNDHYKA